MLYLYYHSTTSYSCPISPCVGNHYELVEVEDEEDMYAYDWEVRQDAAADSFDDDECEWGDHVEREGGVSKWFNYDPTNPVHVEHKGYESQRPEHVAWLAEREAHYLAMHWKERAAKLKEMKQQRINLDHEIECLQAEIDNR